MVSCQALPMDTICPQSCWSAIPGSGVAPPRVMAVAAPWVMCVAPPRFMAVAMEGCGGQGGGDCCTACRTRGVVGHCVWGCVLGYRGSPPSMDRDRQEGLGSLEWP